MVQGNGRRYIQQMRFLGSVQVRTFGWVAVGVVGGFSACSEGENLEPNVDTVSTDSSVSPQGTSSTVTSSGATNSTTRTSSAASSNTATSSASRTSSPTGSATSSSSNPTSSSSGASTSTRESTAATSSRAQTSTASEPDDSSESAETSAASSGVETSDGGKPPADPSDGCGKASPETGSAQQQMMVSGHKYYVKLPQNYDPSKPYPVAILLHPTGDSNAAPWAETNLGFEKNGAKDAAIRVYPECANLGSGWGAGDVAFFKPLYDAVTSNFCADKARVFVTGESSGGDFASIVGCEHGDILRAIGPCATKKVNEYPIDKPDSRTCKGQVDAVVIHGIDDSVVGPANGPLTAEFYRAKNNCSSDTTPVQGFTNAVSNCKEYQGCDDGFGTIFCQHDDPNYSNTSHGWPAFAGDFLWNRWSEL
jgi:polyhydroxybutyrate depolymerase